jgi:hypothetical protein
MFDCSSAPKFYLTWCGESWSHIIISQRDMRDSNWWNQNAVKTKRTIAAWRSNSLSGGSHNFTKGAHMLIWLSFGNLVGNFSMLIFCWQSCMVWEALNNLAIIYSFRRKVAKTNEPFISGHDLRCGEHTCVEWRDGIVEEYSSCFCLVSVLSQYFAMNLFLCFDFHSVSCCIKLTVHGRSGYIWWESWRRSRKSLSANRAVNISSSFWVRRYDVVAQIAIRLDRDVRAFFLELSRISRTKPRS